MAGSAAGPRRRRLPPPGTPEAELDTPALVVDLDAFERNLDRMSEAAGKAGVALRPHAKTHKSIAVARLQIERGAAGVCVQTVWEAEVMAAGGIRDIFLTNEVVGAGKLERAARLAREVTLAVCVDDPGNLDELGRAARRAGAVVRVMVEMNNADYRAGAPPGEPLLRLAVQANDTPSVDFLGLQAYNGAGQHISDYPARLASHRRLAALVEENIDMLARRGVHCRVVSGAGTGTYELEAASGVFNEIQPGSYVFMDAGYLANRDRAGAPFRDFEVSLYVLTTVMSRSAGAVLVDAGLKAVSLGNGPPLVQGARALYTLHTRLADEHGVLMPDNGGDLPPLGEQVRLIPVNCDPTVNLYDHLIGLRNGRVETVWTVDARGY